MNTNNNRQIFRSGLMYIMIFVAIVGLVSWFNQGSNGQTTEVSYTQFVQELKKGDIKEIKMQYANSVYTITGEYKEAKENTNTSSKGLAIFDKRTSKTSNFKTTVLPNDGTVTEINNAAQQAGTQITTLPESQSGIWLSLFLQLVVPLGIFGFLMFNLLSSQMGQGGPRGVMNFGRSKATDQNKQKVKVRFSDVAGAEEEKQELVEVVEFLKDPRKFTALGARIPAGVLLEGPPGTGKTLLAKAVAGEANVPFFSISGSEFVEMFVGVGASRVRDLFENAKKNAPAIIFIDEIDAVGRQRGTGMGGGHDEREQTLNQLLVEMDGFEGTEGVIVIAATNRSDVLDPALLRPGRFDRQILVGRPDVKGREAILKVHARNKKLAKEVDLKVIAQQTPGFSGAELENLLNEAALVAARRDKTAIDKLDVDEAHDRVIAGPAKKDRAISEKERKMVAFHEAGHTIVGMVLSDARVVHKVTIVPRGRAGGYAIMLPKEDRFLMTKKELFEQVVGLLGGRAAEEFIFNEKTTGASNDFEQATGIVRSMITEYGMYDELGTVQYEGNHQVFIGRDYGQTKAYSDQVAFEIDNAVRSIMKEAYAQALQILEEHKDQLTLIAEKLLELETLDERTIKALFETGEMPTEDVEEEYPSEVEAASFEESKKALAKREAAKQDDNEEESDSKDDLE
ncbi:ATP-dependent zinc metalloprotease FtsH [Granulicatella elegans]|uniref:ATP-dependent zinc metalloprotease FtsH n=1 Tax=Granulicatella elegans ATCC 700633 TaxID=626369 RepID=D0BM53_9LACT|nr:ATP-dependent zinc metalloprotease FtsH [Granulicatella elegans]EEW93068.1 ATP-dependent metallopeptidase HflB [Granulicatella elegans ATCC 700633]